MPGAPRFIADADLNEKIIAGLRRREPAIDFLTAREGGTVGLSDPDVLRTAVRAGRILVTHDRNTMPKHFAKLIQNQSSPGLIVVSQRHGIGEVIEQLWLVWAASDAEEWRNQVMFLRISGGG